MNYYGTLGPSCRDARILREMLQAGMTGLRLNLSHGGLRENREGIRTAHQAAEAEEKALFLLADLEGPELRIGSLPEPLELREGRLVELTALGIPEAVKPYLTPGQELLLDDGKILLQIPEAAQKPASVPDPESPDGGLAAALAADAGGWLTSAVKPREEPLRARVIRAGVLESRKSLALPGQDLSLPTLTDHDRENIGLLKELGIGGVMLPFVRGREDLQNLRKELEEQDAGDVKIFAKIENMAGVEHLEELLGDADEIVIARGDLGNSMPLWKLPGVQKRISAVCRREGVPFMVVTQMLDSMRERPVPTRAEMTDVYQAVLDGAASVMLTGETAVGRYPAEAMRYLVLTGREAEADRRKEECS